MKLKINSIIIILLLTILLSGCKKTDEQPNCAEGYYMINETCFQDNQNNTIIDENIGTSEGLEDTSIVKGHYFNPLKGVLIKTDYDTDITHLLSVDGHVDFSTLGSYTLHYYLEYDDETFNATRTITVNDGEYTNPTGDRPPYFVGEVTVDDGSYYAGTNTDIDHPVNPGNIENDLLNSAIPSSGWWTSLLVDNYGGSNGIYTNPLRVAYSNEGMEITNPEDGFVQYWNNAGVQTMAQFPLALKDGFLKSSDLSLGYETKVIDYGDSHVKVALRNPGSSIDHMVTTLVQGSPYIFVETANKDALYYNFDTNGVDGYEYYDITGNQITSSTYTGEAIIVKLVHRHSGYDTSLPANVGAPQYTDKYYLINAPSGTTFTITSNNHPFGLNNRLDISLGISNYLSIAAINDLSEASYYHTNGYSFINDTNISFDVNYETNIVTTDFNYSSQNVRDDNSSTLIALMPHHYKNSSAITTDYSYRTVRGTLKIMEGSSFSTSLSFNGILPGFTTPSNEEFLKSTTITYLENLNTNIDISDSENYINAEGPYWNSKAIYPLAQGIIIADQLGETDLRDSFIEKLKYVLEDWFTYSDNNDEKFLYYNNEWGSVYYSNDDFGTATGLSDHSFTHGYLIYASSVLAMYDKDFVTEFGGMVNLLLDDYMFTEKDDSEFEYLRNFDAFAGHSWAHGFGTFAEGNNLESTSEALNSWNGGYLWAIATGDQERMEAAIYGFVTELSAIKEYWFDYDETNWDPAYGDYVDVAGMVWGGKHDYATWFGANPTFIYGIQWLPTGEYLTSYALNDDEYTKMQGIFNTYLEAKNGEIDTWYSNMWAIESIVNNNKALIDFDSDLILNDDYPNELVGSYWMINAMATLNRRTSDVWMGINNSVAGTVYITEQNNYIAMVWNPTNAVQQITFYNTNGTLLTTTVEANTFVEIDISN